MDRGSSFFGKFVEKLSPRKKIRSDISVESSPRKKIGSDISLFSIVFKYMNRCADSEIMLEGSFDISSYFQENDKNQFYENHVFFSHVVATLRDIGNIFQAGYEKNTPKCAEPIFISIGKKLESDGKEEFVHGMLDEFNFDDWKQCCILVLRCLDVSAYLLMEEITKAYAECQYYAEWSARAKVLRQVIFDIGLELNNYNRSTSRILLLLQSERSFWGNSINKALVKRLCDVSIPTQYNFFISMLSDRLKLNVDNFFIYMGIEHNKQNKRLLHKYINSVCNMTDEYFLFFLSIMAKGDKAQGAPFRLCFNGFVFLAEPPTGAGMNNDLSNEAVDSFVLFLTALCSICFFDFNTLACLLISVFASVFFIHLVVSSIRLFDLERVFTAIEGMNLNSIDTTSLAGKIEFELKNLFYYCIQDKADKQQSDIIGFAVNIILSSLVVSGGNKYLFATALRKMISFVEVEPYKSFCAELKFLLDRLDLDRVNKSVLSMGATTTNFRPQ